MEKYLEFRFRTNNIKRYYEKYYKEWVKNLTHEQIMYFEREMSNLIEKGIYGPGR